MVFANRPAARVRHEEAVAQHRESDGCVQPCDEGNVNRRSGGSVVFANRASVVVRHEEGVAPQRESGDAVIIEQPCDEGGVIAAPVVASYVPTLLKPGLATKRVLPCTARKSGKSSPVEMKGLGLIAAPVVVSYASTVSLRRFATKRLLPNTASPTGKFSPVMKLWLIELRW